MSIITETYLLCDGKDCKKSFGIENRERSSKVHRELMIIEGWKNSCGKDYCRECWDNILAEKAEMKRLRGW